MSQCEFCNEYNCNCKNLITTTLNAPGRFCNHLIRNLTVSFIAKKIDLYVEYSFYDEMSQIGIPLYIGTKLYNDIIILTNENCNEILNNPPYANMYTNGAYCQNEYVSKMIYKFLRNDQVRTNIILKNPFNSRYNKNNDCFVHIRLGDMADMGYNIELSYYIKAINAVGLFDRLYIASDSPDHIIVQSLLEIYKGRSELLLKNEVETIQFGSTCKYVALSHGTFSAVIGWLAFYSEIYYPEYIEGKIWHGDVFSVDPSWNKITDYV